MAPYEITQAGGSVEHWNEEPGYVWMQRFMEKYKKRLMMADYKDAKRAGLSGEATHL